MIDTKGARYTINEQDNKKLWTMMQVVSKQVFIQLQLQVMDVNTPATPPLLF